MSIFFKSLPIYDVEIVDGNNTLYYLHWTRELGFIKVLKEDYENIKENLQ